jgi:hypothetical protein
MHCSTLDHIISLYDAYLPLLNKGDYLTEDEQRQCIEIRRALDQLWPKRRAELTFQAHGKGRLISAPDPRSVRQVARGIQPLPQGGD